MPVPFGPDSEEFAAATRKAESTLANTPTHCGVVTLKSLCKNSNKGMVGAKQFDDQSTKIAKRLVYDITRLDGNNPTLKKSESRNDRERQRDTEMSDAEKEEEEEEDDQDADKDGGGSGTSDSDDSSDSDDGEAPKKVAGKRPASGNVAAPPAPTKKQKTAPAPAPAPAPKRPPTKYVTPRENARRPTTRSMPRV